MKDIVKVCDVSIKYIMGDYRNIGFKDFIIKKIKGTYKIKEFWANKDISFSLDSGDLLGIIGPNGCGKSTLLTAIAGVMDPTLGSIETSGKIAALLELSAGFDEELTARENIFLRASMMGYKEEFIKDKYDEIVEFAEVKEFEDIPIKQFSSGMRSRLAFSIASLVDPDIIIIDEVLAVGDASFRRKSGQKMKEILKSGVTGILVSHSSEQIRELCNKVLWLDHGKTVCFSNDVNTVLNAYEEYNLTKKLPLNDEDIIKMSNSFKDKIKALKNAIK